jgi:NTP pyrophosphatase (non-canonical NTP hydrolase)
MNLEEYSIAVESTRADLEVESLDDLHMVLGIASESGELVDVFKKWLAYGKEIDWVNVQEELGDLMWYIVGMCNINGWDLEDILEQNAAKLKTRYPNKFEETKALNRDLDKEREVLEGKKEKWEQLALEYERKIK